MRKSGKGAVEGGRGQCGSSPPPAWSTGCVTPSERARGPIRSLLLVEAKLRGLLVHFPTRQDPLATNSMSKTRKAPRISLTYAKSKRVTDGARTRDLLSRAIFRTNGFAGVRGGPETRTIKPCSHRVAAAVWSCRMALHALKPQGHMKISSGSNALTSRLGTSTVWLIRRSTATLHNA